MKFKSLIHKVRALAYTALATFDQLWGTEQAFDYLKKLNTNISQYTKSGIAPARNAARGEAAIGIGFLHDYYSLEVENGAPLELISPCEGTGYEIGGVSIIKNARNMDNAKLFVGGHSLKKHKKLVGKRVNLTKFSPIPRLSLPDGFEIIRLKTD